MCLWSCDLFNVMWTSVTFVILCRLCLWLCYQRCLCCLQIAQIDAILLRYIQTHRNQFQNHFQFSFLASAIFCTFSSFCRVFVFVVAALKMYNFHGCMEINRELQFERNRKIIHSKAIILASQWIFQCLVSNVFVTIRLKT